MCGITGFFSPRHLRKSETCVKMNAVIKHRGPDDEGFWLMNDSSKAFYSGKDSMAEIKSAFPQIPTIEDCSLALGFRRLSIVELSEKGHQPMASQNKKLIITFNGEIYNFRELRIQLEQLGYSFESESDTEVILKGYQEWGTEVFAMLNGMFAICIVDLENQKLVFARDRFGLKPLFYSVQKETLCWASEIKAILECDWIERKINWEGVYTNFLFQTTLSPQTCFENISSIEPGTFVEVEIQDELVLKANSFFAFSKVETQNEVRIEEVESLFKTSVQNQLVADVPRAIMMSGGIDSTFLAHQVKQIDSSIPCFTVDYQFSNGEIKNAKSFAEVENLDHRTHQISSETILADLKQKIQHFEEPYVSIEVLLNAAEIAHNSGFKVVLSGNGADELFGGYMHTQKLNRWKSFKVLNPYVSTLPEVLIPYKKIQNYFEQNTLFDFFRNGQGGMRPHEVKSLFKTKKLKNVDTSLNKYHLSKGESYQDYFLLDMRYSLASHHAYRDDLAAMMYSVEFRYPYLDNKLASYVASLPENVRFTGKENKPLLRKIVSKKLPESILNMPKKGFSFPLTRFINENESLKSFVLATIQQLEKRNILNSKLISEWLNEGITETNSSKLWQLLTFELWLQNYLDPTNEN